MSIKNYVLKIYLALVSMIELFLREKENARWYILQSDPSFTETPLIPQATFGEVP